MPYRLDLDDPPRAAVDTLIGLGALDIESADGALAALMPDTVPADAVAEALGVTRLQVSPAVARDDQSVWTLSPRPVRVRQLLIVPAAMPAPPGALRIVEGAAFGTGLHPTTALCLEAIEDLLDLERSARMLDVGTGSGILALAALRRGVGRAVGLDTEGDALGVAAANARLNALADRLTLVHGSLDAVRGSWPLVVANIRAAELMAMAPSMVRRIASRGRLVLSGIPIGVAGDVELAYTRLGMALVGRAGQGGWAALVLRPSW